MRRSIAIGCLVLSGAAGLIYEVCWIRRASLVFGSTTYSLSTVLAVFFLGLALGSWLFGRVSRSSTNPLRLFVGLELGLAVMALASLPAFDLVDGLYGRAFRALSDAPAALAAARVALVALILLPPTILMGGTLPLFCRQLVQGEGRIAGTVAFLYGANTAGAALGCAAAGFLLIPELGVTWSVRSAAALNVAAGLGVLSLRIQSLEPEDRPPPTPAGVEEPRGKPTTPLPVERSSPGVVAALFFLTGFVALGLEVLWTRYLSLLIHNTVHTYTLTLAAVLLGIVLGSWLGSVFLDRHAHLARLFGTLQVILGLIVVATVMVPPATWARAGEHLGIYFAVLLPPAILSGLSFPLAIRMVTADPTLIGLRVGQMTAANTVGGITGSLLIGFVALPALGLERSLLALTALSLTVGYVAWWSLDGPRTGRRVALTAASAGLWVALPLWIGTSLPADFLAAPGTLVDYEEGLEANLAVVVDNEDLHLEIDRWWQGRSRKTHQIMAAHTPMLLHEDPASVLVVGVGVGQTSERFLMYDIERLGCVDIEPRIFDFVREHFDSAWMDDPRVDLIKADGRNYLAHGGASYDVISLELGQISRPGVAAFYTREFYEQVRGSLAPDGLVSQFVPLPFLEPDTLRSLVATFLDVFPQSTLWYNTAELLLIGTNGDRFDPDAVRLELLEAEGPVNADLRYAHWGGPEHWLNRPEVFEGGLLIGPEGLRALAAGAPLLRDDRPVLEHATWAIREQAANELPSVALLREHLAELRRPAAAALREKNLGDLEAVVHLRRFHMAKATAHPSQLETILAEALAANPENVEAVRLLGGILVTSGRPAEAEPIYRRALAIRPEDPTSHLGLATILSQSGRVAESVIHYRSLLRERPQDINGLNGLALALIRLGQVQLAITYLEEAVRLRPDLAQVRLNLEKARSELGGL